MLFSDVVMPGMSGAELARAARWLRPGLPVLLASGYAGAMLGVDADTFDVLTKPYERDELLARLDALVPANADHPAKREGDLMAAARHPATDTDADAER